MKLMFALASALGGLVVCAPRVSAQCFDPERRYTLFNNEQYLGTDSIVGSGVSGRGFTVQGYGLLAGNTIAFNDFVSKTQAEVETQFEWYLDNPGANLVFGPDVQIVLDIEHPVSPPAFGATYLEFNSGTGKFVYKSAQHESDFEALIDAFKVRIAAVRAVMADRNLEGEVGLYGVVVPYDRGQLSTNWDLRKAGYAEAGALGLYDDLDFISPRIYPNVNPTWTGPDGPELSIVLCARRAVEAARELRTTTNQPIPILPMVRLGWNVEFSSVTHHVPYDVDGIKAVICELREQGVTRYGFWANNFNFTYPTTGYTGPTPGDHEALFAEYFVDGDYDHDGDHDSDDLAIWVSLYINGDVAGDLSDNGVVDNTDDAVILNGYDTAPPTPITPYCDCD